MFIPPRENDGHPPQSVFVHGNDLTAVQTLAVGLAMRRHGSFSWADCAASADGLSQASRGLLQRGRSRSEGHGIHPSELVAPHWSTDAVERVLVPENRMDSLRLMSYLALPSLLQELAAMATSPSGESFVVLTNIDALDRGLRASVFGRADLHRSLHEAKVSLFVTAEHRPTPLEQASFDQVLQVEVARDAIWSDGTVRLEKDSGPVRAERSMSLRNAWQRLRLDPTLLPPP